MTPPPHPPSQKCSTWALASCHTKMCQQISCPQVLEAKRRLVPSPAQRSIHSLRSLLLVAKLASLLYQGSATLSPAGPLKLCWSLLGACSRSDSRGCEEEGKVTAERREKEAREVARLESLKVYMMLPLLRRGVTGLAGGCHAEDGEGDDRSAVLQGVQHYQAALTSPQLVRKSVVANEVYRAGRDPVPVQLLHSCIHHMSQVN